MTSPASSIIAARASSHVPVLGRDLQTHSLILGCLLVILGVQAVGLGICARAYGVYFVSDQDTLFLRLRARFRLEHGVALDADRSAHGHRAHRRMSSATGLRRLRRAARGGLAIVAATVIAVAPDLLHVVPPLDPRPSLAAI